jgi:hypothetical protein
MERFKPHIFRSVIIIELLQYLFFPLYKLSSGMETIMLSHVQSNQGFFLSFHGDNYNDHHHDDPSYFFGILRWSAGRRRLNYFGININYTGCLYGKVTEESEHTRCSFLHGLSTLEALRARSLSVTYPTLCPILSLSLFFFFFFLFCFLLGYPPTVYML